MMWQTQTTIEYPFALRPASIEEAGLFYSQMDEAEDAVLGTVGHIRMDFELPEKSSTTLGGPTTATSSTRGNSKTNFRSLWICSGRMAPYESGFDEKLLLPARR